MSIPKSCMFSLMFLSLSIANFDGPTAHLNNSRNSTTVAVSISMVATTATDTTTTADSTTATDATTAADSTATTDATTFADSKSAPATKSDLESELIVGASVDPTTATQAKTSTDYITATSATKLWDFNATTANATTSKDAEATAESINNTISVSTIAYDTTSMYATTATDATTLADFTTATDATTTADSTATTGATTIADSSSAPATKSDFESKTVAGKSVDPTTATQAKPSTAYITATGASELWEFNATTGNVTTAKGGETIAYSTDNTISANATTAEVTTILVDSTIATDATTAGSTMATDATTIIISKTATLPTKPLDATTANDTTSAGSPTATNATTSLDSTNATHKTTVDFTKTGNTTSADFISATDATTLADSTTMGATILTDATTGGDSTDGREFIIVFLQTIVIEKDPTLIVATTDNNCVVTVVIPKIFYFRTYEVAARTKLEIAIPKSIIPKTDGLDNLGILIKSTADISLWGMHDASSRSGDGFLALPTKILGREYFGVSYKPFSGAELGVVGIDDGTTVMITYDHPYTFGDRNIIANYPLKVKLDRFETMFINSHTDITGIHIESSAPVAAFSGNQCAFIPFSSGICNHIVTQLVPFERWGMTYVVTPFFGHIDYVVKVITGRYSSTVSVGGRQHVLEKMTSLTLNLTSSEVITAARPVLVVQFSFGMTLDNGNSYPTMLLVPAMQQFTNDAVIATFSDYHPSLHYLNLVATCYDLEKQYILIDEAQIEFVKKEVYVDGIAHCISQMLLNTSYSRITTIQPNVTFSAIIHERTKMFSTTRAAKLRLTNTTCSTTNKYGVTLAHNCDEKVVIFTYACPEPCPDKKEENYCGPCIDGLAVFIVMFLSSGLTICVEQFVRCCRAACQDEWEVEAWKREAIKIQQRPDTTAWDRQIEVIRKNEIKKLEQEFEP